MDYVQKLGLARALSRADRRSVVLAARTAGAGQLLLSNLDCDALAGAVRGELLSAGRGRSKPRFRRTGAARPSRLTQ